MKRFAAIFALVMALLIPMNAFAAGDGTGTGGGKGEALTVSSATVQDGDTLSAGDSITLTFSKNVTNASVAEANQALFTVADSQGAPVEIQVVMADDQIEPDKKNDVVIQLPQDLADGSYVLTAAAGVTSKSGEAMKEDYTLTFTVGQAAQSGESGAQADGSANDGAASTPADGSAQTDGSADSSAQSTQGSGRNMSLIYFAVVVVILMMLLASANARRRR